MSHFKTQQEIWKYLADGGAVLYIDGTVIKFVEGNLAYNMIFSRLEHWSPYIEPVAKTKVWRWERIGSTTSIIGLEKTIEQTASLHTEEYAKHHLKHYTKVPNSERDI